MLVVFPLDSKFARAHVSVCSSNTSSSDFQAVTVNRRVWQHKSGNKINIFFKYEIKKEQNIDMLYFHIESSEQPF